MEPAITSEIVVAYAQCPRKAYLLLFSPDKGEPHEYVQILEQQRCANQERYLHRLQQTHADVQPYSVENLRKGSKVLINARLQVDGLAADCGVLIRVAGTSTFGKHSYEPTIFVGTHSLSNEQQLALSFVGYVLERLQHTSPAAGRIIGMDGKSHTVKLGASAKALRPLLEPLHAWTTVDPPKPPPIVLNKHCPLCHFQRSCVAQAEQEDNLSLLDGVTARVIRQYERKGIFTVKQLSYLFKPRKRKKGDRKPPPVTHKVELQALAIREQKIYLQELPTLSRQPVELFVDMEGVPDRGVYYQKCWVHLIRDLNSDLLSAPLGSDHPHHGNYTNVRLKEAASPQVSEARGHFYKEVIRKRYTSEVATKYQERFLRYQDSLFTFLQHDGIPWRNNTAERAIRHLARQRDISGSFHASGARDYLILLIIRQKYLYQGKSFFKFLFSGETDLDKFEARKRTRSQAIPQ